MKINFTFLEYMKKKDKLFSKSWEKIFICLEDIEEISDCGWYTELTMENEEVICVKESIDDIIYKIKQTERINMFYKEHCRK